MSALKPHEINIDILSGDLVYEPSPNFSYNNIPTGCFVKLPIYQQMIVHSNLNIQGTIDIHYEVDSIGSDSLFTKTN